MTYCLLSQAQSRGRARFTRIQEYSETSSTEDTASIEQYDVLQSPQRQGRVRTAKSETIQPSTPNRPHTRPRPSPTIREETHVENSSKESKRSQQFAPRQMRTKSPVVVEESRSAPLPTLNSRPTTNGTRVVRRKRIRVVGNDASQILQPRAKTSRVKSENIEKAIEENQELSSSRRTEVVYQNTLNNKMELLKTKGRPAANVTQQPAQNNHREKYSEVKITSPKSINRAVARRYPAKSAEPEIITVAPTQSTQARRPSTRNLSPATTTTTQPPPVQPISRGTTRNSNLSKVTTKPKQPKYEDLQDENYPEHYKLILKAKLEVNSEPHYNEVTPRFEKTTKRPLSTRRIELTTSSTLSTSTTAASPPARRVKPYSRVNFPKLNKPTATETISAEVITDLTQSGILPSAAGEYQLATSTASPKYSSRIRQNENRAQEPSHKLRPRSQGLQKQRNNNFLDSNSPLVGQARHMPSLVSGVIKEPESPLISNPVSQ